MDSAVENWRQFVLICRSDVLQDRASVECRFFKKAMERPLTDVLFFFF